MSSLPMSQRPLSQPHQEVYGRSDEPSHVSSSSQRFSKASPGQEKSGRFAPTLKWIGVAVVLTTLAVAALGLLVFLGKLNVAWAGAGSLSQSVGLYAALGGVGVAMITTILLSVSHLMSRAKANAEKQCRIQQNSNNPTSHSSAPRRYNHGDASSSSHTDAAPTSRYGNNNDDDTLTSTITRAEDLRYRDGGVESDGSDNG